MDEQYKKAKDIFLAVCSLDTAEREEVLNRECGGDAELRAEVDSLLEHHDVPPTATVPYSSAGGGAEQPDRGPKRIGPYRIIREIGRGGMGVVYLGVREGDRFRKHVAVKVLKRGMDTEEILKRFEQERQVLAALNHPGVARLYDAGETEDRLPYFAMEYIEGQPIDDYCDTHRLRITERLTLFRKVCGAVHYVHQNLMVHRDLKPSNILVTADGTPKLLDFGIAKLINPEISILGADPTAVDRRIMTPEYASPEQVRGNPVGVASDIYSLGVILYELLTGHRPYHIKSRVIAEMERVICEVDPDRPSTAATKTELIEADEHDSGVSTKLSLEHIAKVREGRPARLRRRLAGDIDNIVLMALRKEPQRRYKSADQFAEDLARHLDGLPVVARQDTTGYRFAKFVRRHRAGVAAAAVFVIALMGWGVTAANGWASETRHSRALTAERDRTRLMLDAVLELAHVFIHDFHDKIKPLDGSLPVRLLLAETAQECLEDVRPHVADDAKLLNELAAAYDKVGDIWGGHGGESWGKTDIALANYQTALAMRQTLLDTGPPDDRLRYQMAVSRKRIGDVLRFTGDLGGALKGYRAFLDVTESLRDTPKYRRGYAVALGLVGSALKDLGRLEESRQHYQRSLDVRLGMRADRPEDERAVRDVGVGYVHLAEAWDLLGDKHRALELHREAINVRDDLVRTYPDDGRNRRYLALSHYFTAGLLIKLDRPSDAATHVETAVPIFEQRAKDNPTSARATQDLMLGREIQGRLQAALDDHQGALASYDLWQALAVELTELDPDNTFYRGQLAESHECIGTVRHDAGYLTAAVWAYQQSYEIVLPLAEADPDDADLQVQLARVLSSLGAALIDTGALDEAQSRLTHAKTIQESVLADAPNHARARAGLVVTTRRLSRLDPENSAIGPEGP